MREILFKGKAKGGRWNGWIEGDLIHYKNGQAAIVEVPFSKYGCEATEIVKRTEVIPETICQYTGLTDKNGNKIWENDVVKLTRNVGYKSTKGRKFKVYFNNFLCHFALSFGQEENEAFDYMELSGKKASIIEVVGNIFDNPELLEEGAE